jgi:two-component system cell cycle sensor histidine kinase/response regulator CckA
LPDPKIGLVWLAAGSTLLSAMALVLYLTHRHSKAQKQLYRTIAGFVELDASPSFTTDCDGKVGYRNKAAVARFGSTKHDTMTGALGNVFASPKATLRRLQRSAQDKGFASEDVVMRRGHLRLSVHQIGDDGFLWRLEDVLENGQGGRSSEGISLPMLTLSKSDTILFMNGAMRRLINGRQTKLDRVFNDLPLQSGRIHEIAGPDGTVCAQVSIVNGSAGRKEVYLLPAADQSDFRPHNWEPLEALPVALLNVAADGKILVYNRLARGSLATSEPKGLYLGDLVEGLGRSVSDWLADSAEKPGEICSEFVRASRQSKDVYLQVNLTPSIENGKKTLVAVLNDATKLKTLEAQFVQSQKMQAIGQLAGGVAHGFNNLLTAISGHCDLMMLRHDEGDPDYGDLIQIHQNSNRAASLVGQLLAFSRKQTLTPESIDIRDVLDDLTHLLNRLVGEKVSLSLGHDSELSLIRADKRQLEQVILNLVVNARDAMPEGGEIRVNSKVEHLAKPFERDRATVPAGDYVVVTVSDQGVGIAPDKLPKIFEPFYTTKRTGEGTGLGLSMAYGIVKQTGGYIFADSVVGAGCNFTLYFPICHDVDEPEPVVKSVSPGPPRPNSGGVILLVEDEAPVRAFASRALKMRGYTVLEAESAEEALKTLEDQSLDIDVFVTDVIMPGMDGPSWVAKALKDRPGVRVVFVSGYAEDSFSEQQARIPNSVFLPKPFSLTELTATVQDQIH